MSSGTLACADQLSKVVRGRASRWMDLYRHAEAIAGFLDMRSLNSLVTDSAAASSSWGSGSRVVNGALNMFPDGRKLRTLNQLFGEAGWYRGLVTTTEMTHATPAGFTVNVPSRGNVAEIAVQYLEQRIDVLLGGGRPHFEAERRADRRDLVAEFRAWGYEVMHDRQDLLDAAPRGRWLGLFANGHLPYTVDHQASPSLQAEVPTLAEMTRRAIELLERQGRFLLQVEGGRVDHGAHASDAAATLFDQLAFDDAVDVALEFQRENPDTLLVVTTDHGNSNPGLNGMGSGYGESGELLANLKLATCSFGEIQRRLQQRAGPDAKQKRTLSGGATTRDVLMVEPKVIAEVLDEAVGYRPSDRQAEGFARYLAGDWMPLLGQLDSYSAQLGQLLANHFGIGWTGTSHTSDYVPVLAIGPGADRFRGFQAGTEVFRHYTGLAGIRHRNPELPLMAEAAPTAEEVEERSLA